ncbi:MAG TPA: hypothetical protein VM008_22440 [Phycisphaerae bacterium]|nr:hypothetical protein [Phycisphaerae bacterium]
MFRSRRLLLIPAALLSMAVTQAASACVACQIPPTLVTSDSNNGNTGAASTDSKDAYKITAAVPERASLGLLGAGSLLLLRRRKV